MLQLHTMFSQDPSLQPMYSPENRYQMMKNIMEQQGILNVGHLTPPDQLPPPQPDPMAEMQAQMAQQLELQERQTAIAEMRVQTDAATAQAKIQQCRRQPRHALQSDNQDLKEASFEHKRMIDEGELEILRRKTTDVRGIASPTG